LINAQGWLPKLLPHIGKYGDALDNVMAPQAVWKATTEKIMFTAVSSSDRGRWISTTLRTP
jgi:hypothetical protein